MSDSDVPSLPDAPPLVDGPAAAAGAALEVVATGPASGGGDLVLFKRGELVGLGHRPPGVPTVTTWDPTADPTAAVALFNAAMAVNSQVAVAAMVQVPALAALVGQASSRAATAEATARDAAARAASADARAASAEARAASAAAGAAASTVASAAANASADDAHRRMAEASPRIEGTLTHLAQMMQTVMTRLQGLEANAAFAAAAPPAVRGGVDGTASAASAAPPAPSSSFLDRLGAASARVQAAGAYGAGAAAGGASAGGGGGPPRVPSSVLADPSHAASTRVARLASFPRAYFCQGIDNIPTWFQLLVGRDTAVTALWRETWGHVFEDFKGQDRVVADRLRERALGALINAHEAGHLRQYPEDIDEKDLRLELVYQVTKALTGSAVTAKDVRESYENDAVSADYRRRIAQSRQHQRAVTLASSSKAAIPVTGPAFLDAAASSGLGDAVNIMDGVISKERPPKPSKDGKDGKGDGKPVKDPSKPTKPNPKKGSGKG